MRAGRNQVGDIAGALAGGIDVYGHQLGGVPGKHFAEMPGTISGAGAFDERHLTGGDQRIVIVADIADAVAFQLSMAVLHLPTMREVARVGKCRNDLAGFVSSRVPSAMVKVQVGIDDDIDFFRANPSRLDRL